LDAPFAETLRTYDPQLLVVVAFGRIFSREFLDFFPQGGVNLHASLLPKYRGPAPVSAAILSGESRTGVTVQKLAPKMDAGDILGARTLALTGEETTGSLSAVLADLGAELLPEILSELEKGKVRPIAQDEAQASYCRLVRKEHGQIDWSADAGMIERMIRAYDPWPRAFTTWQGQRLTLLAGGVYPETLDTGSREQGLVLDVDNRYGILVKTGGGVLYLHRLQLQAKKPLDWRSFLNGQKDFIGSQLGECR
jgi:methionyl-tRNA formyltransferase